jgi:hypothetical protein
MRILDMGGITAIHDPKIHADINKHGSYETKIESLDFAKLDGKSVKVFGAQQLFNLPEGKYKVIIPTRDAKQVLLSRASAFKQNRVPQDDAKLVDMVRRQIEFVKFVVKHRDDMELLEIPSDEYYTHTENTIDKIADFVGAPFDKVKALQAVDKTLFKIR